MSLQRKQRSTLRKLTLVTTSSILFASKSHAQQATILNPSQVPACALQCPILLQAQQQCVPPYQPVTNQATYNACFCKSNLITGFQSGQTTGYCDGICSQQDMQALQTWFTGTVCQPQAVSASTATTMTTAAAPTTGQPSTTVLNGQTTTIAASVATATPATRIYNAGGNRSWIAANYGWVIMAVVLVLAAIIAISLGCWWKRRHQRRRRKDPNYRDSTTIANEVAASFANKHPIIAPNMTQTPEVGAKTDAPVAAAPPAAPLQSGKPSSRPASSTVAQAPWQGGAAGVAIAAGNGSRSSGSFAAAAAASAAMRNGINRQSSGASTGRAVQLQQRPASDISLASTPDILDRNNPTPLSESDRPLLASTAELPRTTSTSPGPEDASAAGGQS